MLIATNDADLRAWRARVTACAQSALARLPGPILGPVALEATFTLERPRSAPRGRVWPDRFPDIDKLVRAICDAITRAGLWADDARVIDLTARKTYPDSPCPDRLDTPGVTIRIRPITLDPALPGL